MKQSRTSSIYDSKIFWAIFSLLASVALWAFISNQESSTINKQLTGIQVQFSGEDLLREERGLAISNVDNSSVNVWIRGSRRAIGSLDASRVAAVIDVSKITQAGDMSWSYTLKYPAGTDTSAISVISRTPETIGFTVSALTTKTIEIRGAFDGSLADGFTAEDPVFEPSTISVTGSEAALSKISYAKVSFSKAKVSETFSVDVGYTLMDTSDRECSTAGLTFSTEVVKATLPIMQVKEVPLAVSLINGGGATDKDCTVDIEPKTIKLAGDSKLLDKLNKIVIAAIDLSSFTESFENTYPITIDDDIQNITGLASATVKVSIVGMTTKTFNVTNISCINVADGYSAQVDTENIPVVIRGTEDALASLTADKLQAVADMSEYKETAGAVMPSVKVSAQGVPGVGAIGNYKITVTLSKGS